MHMAPEVPAMFKHFLAILLAAACSLATAAPELAPSRFNDGASVDDEPMGRRIPLVLVHGLGGSGQGWEQFLKVYAANASWRAAFKPYTFRYASKSADVTADPAAPRTISGLGKSLIDSLQAHYDKPASAPHYGFGGKSMVVMAHSMGGLVARSMMQEHTFPDGRSGGERVLHLITLGTPHMGTPMADAAFALGLQYSDEFRTAYLGFVAGMTWTHHDAKAIPGGVCNPWLAALNNYAPSASMSLGTCGFAAQVPKRGFYERIIAYGARTLQQPDIPLPLGMFKPGSEPALLAPYIYMHDVLDGHYDNDGVVPFASARFTMRDIASRHEAYACDHRYLERGYPVLVKAVQGTSSAWTFCSASVDGAAGLSKSIHGSVGGIVERIRAVSDAERLFAWAEVAHAGLLQPSGAVTDVAEGYLFRHYASTGALVGVKDGWLYYKGPASGQQILRVGSVTEMLKGAALAGY